MIGAGTSSQFGARRAAVGIATSVLGCGLLVWQVRTVGVQTIRDGLAQVGWGFLVILALSFVRFGLRTLAWTTLIGEPVSLASAVAATLSGDALGNLTPLSLIVGEPAKALYLRDRVPVSRSFAALTAENFFYSVSVAVFIVLGTITLLDAFAVPFDVRVAGLLALALMAVVLSAALWIVWRKPALVSAVLGRVPAPKLGALVERVRDFEIRTYAFVRQTHGRPGVVLACETGFHVVSFAEAYYTVWLITGRSAPLAAFVLDTFNRIVNIVFRAVPFKVGVDEVSTSKVAEVVGFASGAGVTLALVRKGRMLVWAAVGVALAVRRGLKVRDVMESERK